MFFSIGLPGGFTQWCDEVLTRLAQDAVGPMAVIHVNSLEELARAVIRTGAAQAVVLSRHPTRPLLSAITEAQQPFIVAMEEPHLVLCDLNGQGHDFLEATRFVARSCAAMVGFAAAPGGLLLNPGRDGADPLATVALIAQHLRLALAPERIAEIAGAIGPFDAASRRAATAGWWDALEEPMRVAATGALQPFAEHFTGAPLGAIVWERELFFLNEKATETASPAGYPVASRPIDITGRGRHLIFGPYLALPPGLWAATVALGFSETAADMSYVVDIYAGTQLAVTHIDPRGQRLVEVTLDFSIEETLEAPIEVRIGIERPAFDGRLALGHVIVAPRGHMRAETRDYFTAALNE